MPRASGVFLAGVLLTSALGCRSDESVLASAAAPDAQTATAPAPSPAAAPAAAPVAEKLPELAARCEAVPFTPWAPRDHMSAELRAIATELVNRGAAAALPEIEESLPRSVNLRRTAPDVLYRWP